MFRSAALIAFTYAAVVLGQQIGTLTIETHPPITIQECTASGCTPQQKSVVLDSNWRWTHSTSGSDVSESVALEMNTWFSIVITLSELLHWQLLGPHSLPRPCHLREQLCH